MERLHQATASMIACVLIAVHTRDSKTVPSDSMELRPLRYIKYKVNDKITLGHVRNVWDSLFSLPSYRWSRSQHFPVSGRDVATCCACNGCTLDMAGVGFRFNWAQDTYLPATREPRGPSVVYRYTSWFTKEKPSGHRECGWGASAAMHAADLDLAACLRFASCEHCKKVMPCPRPRPKSPLYIRTYVHALVDIEWRGEKDRELFSHGCSERDRDQKTERERELVREAEGKGTDESLGEPGEGICS